VKTKEAKLEKILNSANQKAIEYAQLKHSEEPESSTLQNSISESEIDFVRGYMACFSTLGKIELIDAAPEMLSTLKKVYEITSGPYDDIVIEEDLYSTIKELVEKFA
jgi:hypothetical protein